MGLAQAKYLRFTTTKRDGTQVATPVWLADLADGRVGFYTSSTSGKVKRLRHTPRALVQPSDFRGNPISGTSPVEVEVTLVDGPELVRIHDLVTAKYGAFQVRLARVGAVVGGWVKRKPQPYGDVGVTFTVPDDDAPAT